MAMGQPLDAGMLAFLQETFGCAPEIAASIGRRAADRRFALRTIILRQGDRADAAYLVVLGRAHAMTYGGEGQAVLLREYLRGDFFGALAGTAPEDADIVAIEEVRSAVFGAAEFLALIERYSCVGLVVSRVLLRQLRASSARIVESTTLSAAGRIHAELLRLARLGDGRTIRPAPVLTALATRVNTTRETVSRTIGALERRGIIRRDGKTLTIVSPRALEELTV